MWMGQYVDHPIVWMVAIRSSSCSMVAWALGGPPHSSPQLSVDLAVRQVRPVVVRGHQSVELTA